MTFKHTKFEESPSMRSLVRVAYEKGLIKDEPIQKTASPQFDLTPSNDLVDNLMKLCSGLRRSGFDKQAEELEGKFLQYKQAHSLYDISGEDGDDLIHSAHPKGSHKMEDIDSGEATFEDVIDKHLKILNVVNSRPTGKLASSKDIINAVKTVLGDCGGTNFLAQKKVAQSTNEEQHIEGSIQKAVSTINGNISRINEITSSELTFSISQYVVMIADLLKNPKLDNLNETMRLISAMETRLSPHSWLHYTTIGASGLSEDTWQKVQGLLTSSKNAANDAINLRTKLVKLQSGDEASGTNDEVSGSGSSQKNIATTNESVASNQLIGKYKELSNSINRDIARVQANGLTNEQQLSAWLKKADGFVDKYLKEYSDSQFKDDLGVINGYSSKYDAIKSKLDAFEGKWLS